MMFFQLGSWWLMPSEQMEQQNTVQLYTYSKKLMPKIHCVKCDSWIRSEWHYNIHSQKCIGQKPWRQRPTNGQCKFCDQKIEPKKMGAHVVSCLKNPNRDMWKLRISQSQTGKKLSEEHRQKLSKVVLQKVEEGTWHLSFSKSRTHEYGDTKFHGMWEVRYAKYLDQNNIKWRRPTEKFKYTFEGKDSYYTPDFYLPEQNLYIEIKGYKVSKDEAKWSQFPLKLQVLMGKDLVELGLLDEKEVKYFPG